MLTANFIGILSVLTSREEGEQHGPHDRPLENAPCNRLLCNSCILFLAFGKIQALKLCFSSYDDFVDLKQNIFVGIGHTRYIVYFSIHMSACYLLMEKPPIKLANT